MSKYTEVLKEAAKAVQYQATSRGEFIKNKKENLNQLELDFQVYQKDKRRHRKYIKQQNAGR